MAAPGPRSILGCTQPPSSRFCPPTVGRKESGRAAVDAVLERGTQTLETETK